MLAGMYQRGTLSTNDASGIYVEALNPGLDPAQVQFGTKLGISNKREIFVLTPDLESI